MLYWLAGGLLLIGHLESKSMLGAVAQSLVTVVSLGNHLEGRASALAVVAE
jgi:hypothetical protein